MRVSSSPETRSTAVARPGKAELSPEKQQEVERLKKRDAEVRAHEAAHAAAAGGAGGGASFSYTTGPDGKRYATGGEVQVSIQSGHTPEETIRNAQQVRAAALAPAEPSAQDRAVAAEAAAMEAQARQQQAPPTGDKLRNGVSTERELAPAQIENERRVERGGWRHLHSEDGCANCARAVAAYRG